MEIPVEIKSGLRLLKRVPLGLALRLLTFYFARKVLALPATLSFSQTGEDRVLSFYLPEQSGFYVDVGANDPLRLSSSFIFYMKGWRGIAIDANEVLVNRFRRTRKQDICVVAAVSDSERDVIFHRSDSHAVSTIDNATYQAWQRRWKFRPENQVELRTRTLTSILQMALPDQAIKIDFLSIDVEGHEFQVLSGLDFSLYRPRMIAVEIHDLESIFSSRIYHLLSQKRYSLVGYVTMNAYFADSL